MLHGTDSVVIYAITEDFYEDIADDVKKLFDTSNYNKVDKRPLPTGETEKIIGIFKEELRGKIIKKFVGLRAKKYGYLMDDDTEHKNAKATKKYVMKREVTFKNYEDCLLNDKTILKSQQRFKSGCHNVYTMYILNKSIRLHSAVMMIRDYKQLINVYIQNKCF